ncbi:hypothetical protein [Streptomyces sp. NPDC055886]
MTPSWHMDGTTSSHFGTAVRKYQPDLQEHSEQAGSGTTKTFARISDGTIPAPDGTPGAPPRHNLPRTDQEGLPTGTARVDGCRTATFPTE